MSSYSPKGTHITFDLYGVDYVKLNDASYLSEVYRDAIELSGATIRKYQEEIFEPEGVTFTFLLSESHASAHSYPSDEVLMGCIHTCGEHVNTYLAVQHIIEKLKPQEFEIKSFKRGYRW